MVCKMSQKDWMPMTLTNVQDGAKHQIIADPLVLGKIDHSKNLTKILWL